MALASTMTAVFERYTDRPALAERTPVPRSDEDLTTFTARTEDSYDLLTYGELARRVSSVAAQLTDGRRGAGRLAEGDMTAFLGFAGADYVTADLACNLAGVTTVPLQTSASLDHQATILAATAPRALAVSVSLLGRAAELLAAQPTITRLLVLDYRGGDPDHVRELASLEGTSVLRPELLDLSGTGAAVGAPWTESRPVMLLHTSGSTGTPKGAVYPERLVTAMWGGDGWSEFFAAEPDVSTFHYMPMSHVAGHSSVRGTLARGGLTYFASSTNLSSLFEDLALARPTELSLVPRVCELMRQEFRRRLQAARSHTPGGDDNALAAAVRDEMRTQVLGGNVRWASCTSAPISAELKAFVEDLLQIDVHELYGTTEIGGVLSNGRFLRPPVLDHRLEDVPELGYYSSDRPRSRGELLIRSTSTIPGYYGRPDLDEQIFTDDGFYRTGDIASVDDSGTVRIVDRKNAIVKLSQGEFVALPSLEGTYVSRSEVLRQVYLHGDGSESSILAVAVPTDELVDRLGGDVPAIHEHLLQEFRAIGAAESLNSYEVPRDVLVELEPFSESNGLLSDHRKLVRPELARRYGPVLTALYESLRSSSDALLEYLRDSAGDAPTVATVRDAVAIAIGTSPADIGAEDRFRDLGGDSLTAVYLSNLLEQIFGVRVPVNTIAGEATTIGRLADLLDARRNGDGAAVSFDSVHGDAPELLRAEDLRLALFLGDGFTPAPVESVIRDAPTVLITGANGFLGRFLCLEWLREVAATGGRVICIVRGADDDEAYERLRRAFTSDERLLKAFDGFGHSLEVLAGDLSEPALGLDANTWDRLARDVHRVVHAGAMVNHALPYQELFDANVAGTAEVVRLAVSVRLKPVSFVSSIATALLAGTENPLDEHADIRRALPSVGTGTKNNVEGYAATKWAGEVLLREAHDSFQLPVTTFRASMILAHSEYVGQINVPDTFSRLVYSLVRTGVAPSSFYAPGAGRPHYDGLPVDVVASCIVALDAASQGGYSTHHVVNPLDDGVSLDTMVDWLTGLGVELTKVDDHTDWHRRLGAGLRALSESERRASILPLLDSFSAPEQPVAGSSIASPGFLARVQDLGLDTRIRSLDARFVEKSLSDLEHVHGRPLRTA
ncbi:carboxylic acid reductase [Myceligenerans cantabricum]